MIGAAGVLFMAYPQRVLMVRTGYKQHWDIPGGMIEAGELPRDAAAREVKEELGIVVEVGRLLVCETVLLSSGKMLTAWIFQGPQTREPYDVTVDGDEVLEAQWLDYYERVEKTKTAPIFKKRLDSALAAFIAGDTRYYGTRA